MPSAIESIFKLKKKIVLYVVNFITDSGQTQRVKIFHKCFLLLSVTSYVKQM